MKKLFLILGLFSFFLLASCNNSSDNPEVDINQAKIHKPYRVSENTTTHNELLSIYAPNYLSNENVRSAGSKKINYLIFEESAFNVISKGDQVIFLEENLSERTYSVRSVSMETTFSGKDVYTITGIDQDGFSFFMTHSLDGSLSEITFDTENGRYFLFKKKNIGFIFLREPVSDFIDKSVQGEKIDS